MVSGGLEVAQAAWLGVLSLLLATSPSSAAGTQQTGVSVHLTVFIPKSTDSLLEQERGLSAWGTCGYCKEIWAS